MSRRSYPIPAGMKPCQICRLPASKWNIHGHEYTLCKPWHFDLVTKLAAMAPGQRVDLSLLDLDLHMANYRLWVLEQELSPPKDADGRVVRSEPPPEFLGFKDRNSRIPDVRPSLPHDPATNDCLKAAPQDHGQDDGCNPEPNDEQKPGR